MGMIMNPIWILLIMALIISPVIAQNSNSLDNGVPTSLSELKPYRIDSGNIWYDGEAGIKIGGVSYIKGIKLEGGSNNLYFNLGGKYSRLTGSVGIDDQTTSGRRAVVSFEGDDKNLATFNLVAGDFPTDIDINTLGVRRLIVKFSGPGYWAGTFVDLIDMELGPTV